MSTEVLKYRGDLTAFFMTPHIEKHMKVGHPSSNAGSRRRKGGSFFLSLFSCVGVYIHYL